MRRTLLDTSVLIRHWRDCRGKTAVERVDDDLIGSWVDALFAIEKTKATLTPVVLEYLAGVRDRRELGWARAYLGRLEVVDEGRILPEDFVEARRLVEWIPPSGRPRDMGDCLIRAIANRLNYDVRTFDTGMPR